MPSKKLDQFTVDTGLPTEITRLPDGEVWHPNLVASVWKVAYDFQKEIGTLIMPPDCCCDMSGAITFFESIDAAVRRINTFAGDKADTYYIRKGSEWKAYLPKLDS